MTTPSAPSMEGEHFIDAQPPLLFQEGKSLHDKEFPLLEQEGWLRTKKNAPFH